MAAVSSGTGQGLAPVGRIRGNGNQESSTAFSLASTMDEAHRLISGGQTAAGMDLLANELLAFKNANPPEVWDTFLHSEAVRHPVCHLLWQDPFTSHSFCKPSGYAGDARLLDYIYGLAPAPETTTPVGLDIFRYTIDRFAPRSVRSRIGTLARVIDETADRGPDARVLSVACGHLREAGLSKAVREGRIRELVGLDQDAESLGEVELAYRGRPVRTVEMSVRQLLTNRSPLRDFDLVYSAGLYDYLADRMATRLTRVLFDMVAPGGRLLLANFAPCLPDIGYMEAFMGWKLIYRDPEQMIALCGEIGGNEWSSQRLFWDEHENVIFLELVKRRTTVPRLSVSKGLKNAGIPGRSKVTFGDGVSSRTE